jgi:predicted O-methyltransferase YrrM
MTAEEIISVRDNSKSLEEIEHWLSNNVGIKDTEYFGGNLQGGLKIQQNPKEYAKFLWYLKYKNNINSYLEIGVGDGGSFIINSIFSRAKIAVCVDDLSYEQLEKNLLDNLKVLDGHLNYKFYNISSEFILYFNELKNKKFDCILIDGDHSYQGVKSDFENSLKMINQNGDIIFHDVFCQKDITCLTGCFVFWKKITKVFKNSFSFKDENNPLGFGIISIK